jgi:nucleoside-triphosphatase THEP1
MAEGSAQAIFLVTGRVQGGKTTYLAALVDLLRKKGLRIAGLLAPGSFSRDERSGFTILDIVSGQEIPMASAKEHDGWIHYRRFWFNPQAFVQGRDWIDSALLEDPDVLVIDEVGPMELEGSGWSDGLETWSTRPVPVQLWSVRITLLSELMRQWDVPAGRILRMDRMIAEQAAEMIYEHLRNKKKPSKKDQ